MITFIKRAEKRFNYYRESGNRLDIEVSYHYGHKAWMWELCQNNFRTTYGHYFESAEEAMFDVCNRLEIEYRVMDFDDLALEEALLEE